MASQRLAPGAQNHGAADARGHRRAGLRQQPPRLRARFVPFDQNLALIKTPTGAIRCARPPARIVEGIFFFGGGTRRLVRERRREEHDDRGEEPEAERREE